MRKFVLCAALLCAAGSATAQDMVSQQGSITVRLTQKSCASPELAVLLMGAGAQTEPKAFSLTVRQRTVQGCWAVDDEQDVLLADEMGGRTYLPMKAFKPEHGV